MSVTDIKLATDPDGTEHWQRRYISDDVGLIRKFFDLDTGLFVNYGAFYDVTNLEVEQAINVLNQRAMAIGVVYWTPTDFGAAFPETAVLGDRTFNYTIERGVFADAPATIFANLTRDLLDGATVVTHPAATDHHSINQLIDVDNLGTTYFDPAVLDFSALASGDEVSYALAVSDALWLAMQMQSEWAAIRFAFFAQSGTISDADDASAVFSKLNDDGITHTSIMPYFAQAFTIPGTVPPPFVITPKYHNARQVLDAHRQPPILIGRRRFGRSYQR